MDNEGDMCSALTIRSVIALVAVAVKATNGVSDRSRECSWRAVRTMT